MHLVNILSENSKIKKMNQDPIERKDVLKNYISELSRCFKSLGIKKGESLYVTGNVSRLGRVRIPKEKKLEGLHRALNEIIGDEGSIFSPAASMNLCNTDIPFDINKTPSNEMGPLAEYLRLLPNASRSPHPFWSIAGSGKNAYLLEEVSRHAYGLGSPWTHLLDLNTRQVNFGLHPSKAVTLIHHIETLVGVPYRYNKEFFHPIVNGDEVKRENFYLSVMYLNSDIQKRVKLNEHFFKELESKGLLSETKHESGLRIWSFLMRDFYNITTPFFMEDIYTYLETPPTKRPYSI